MATAIALVQAGVSCEIVEISEDWRPGGIGIALQSAPLRATKQLGIFDELVGVGRSHRFIDMCGADGTRFAEVPQVNVNDPDDPPFLGMARQSLHEVMAAEVARLGVEVRLGVTASHIADPSADGVDVDFTDGSSGHYDIVVGADGIYSATRAATLHTAGEPQYAGQVIWRAETDLPEGLDRYTMMIAGPIRLGLVPLPDGRLYVWMLDSTVGPERPPRETLLGLFQERISRFGGVAPQVAAQLTDVTQLDFRALPWLLVPPPWGSRRVVLIGDAVHATTPHIAFGAGLALEDAVVLGELVAAGTPFDELAAAMATRRYSRSKLVVETSLQLSRWEQEPGPPNPEAGPLIGRAMAQLAAAI
jgi:2-polyprenyl-6-methoxyphenol hydroxylase-like FAD-dependent oxidoreductase